VSNLPPQLRAGGGAGLHGDAVVRLYDFLAGLAASTPYANFLYNSSSTQGANRYNNWDDLITALGSVEGPKNVIFEQDEVVPSGVYNFDGVTLLGNGLQGAIKVTLSDGVQISSWINGGLSRAGRRSSRRPLLWIT